MVVRERIAPGDNLDNLLKQPVLIAFSLVPLFSASGVHGVIFLTISSCLNRAPMLERDAPLPYPNVRPGVTLQVESLLV